MAFKISVINRNRLQKIFYEKSTKKYLLTVKLVAVTCKRAEYEMQNYTHLQWKRIFSKWSTYTEISRVNDIT